MGHFISKPAYFFGSVLLRCNTTIDQTISEVNEKSLQ